MNARKSLIGLGLTGMLFLTACGGGGAGDGELGEVSSGVSAADGLGSQENADRFQEMYQAAVD